MYRKVVTLLTSLSISTNYHVLELTKLTLETMSFYGVLLSTRSVERE